MFDLSRCAGKVLRGNETFLFAFRCGRRGTIVAEYPQLASLPILAGPYNRRRLVRLRTKLRQIGMMAVAIMATGAMFVLVF